jgi:transcriptional regulator with XRE-family HTH domain
MWKRPMNGFELRGLRLSKQMTQAELGEALGLTGQYVGLMERGAKPIELRTELAARYLVERAEPNARVKGLGIRDRLIDIETECWTDLTLQGIVEAKRTGDRSGETFTFFVKNKNFEAILEGLDD